MSKTRLAFELLWLLCLSALSYVGLGVGAAILIGGRFAVEMGCWAGGLIPLPPPESAL